MASSPIKVSDEYHRLLGEIGDDLKTLMTQKNISVKDLAEKCGIKSDTISSLINGKSNTLTLSTIIIIYRGLDTRCRFSRYTEDLPDA